MYFCKPSRSISFAHITRKNSSYGQLDWKYSCPNCRKIKFWPIVPHPTLRSVGLLQNFYSGLGRTPVVWSSSHQRTYQCRSSHLNEVCSKGAPKKLKAWNFGKKRRQYRSTVTSLWFLRIFSKHLFCRYYGNGCFSQCWRV